MPLSRSEFVHSSAPEPHRARTKRLLKERPEIRNLIGNYPGTLVWTLAIVVGQLAIAWFVAGRSWWWVFGAAYLVGAFANHALFVVIHECTHKLVFRKKAGNTLTGLLANLPLAFPSYIGFAKYHIKHHAFQGIYELDADLPYEWEARLFGRSVLGKMLWLALFPFVEFLRPLRIEGMRMIDGWTLINAAIQFGFDGAVWMVLGPKALIYLVASFFFSIGLHPLGARWIQRHYLVGGTSEQETFSYYGKLNALAFNVGYHNEHHDFPSVSWNKLPRIYAAAPDVYGNLFYHTSWTRLLVRFLTDPTVSLHDRVVRRDRGKVAFDDAVIPDQEAAVNLKSL
jgi:sphingolipid 4-desaturase/C4-monooxygenase